jgi:hypothetical protein
MSPLIPPALLLAVGVVTSQADPVTSFNLTITSANGGSDTLVSWSYTGTPTIANSEFDFDLGGVGFYAGNYNNPMTSVAGSNVDGYTGGYTRITGLTTGLVLTNTTTLASYILNEFMFVDNGFNDVFLFTWPSEQSNLSINVDEAAEISGPTSGSFLSGLPFSSFNAGQWSSNLAIHSNFSSGLTIGGSAIPEPSTYGLVMGSLALVGAAMRRRKKA